MLSGYVLHEHYHKFFCTRTVFFDKKTESLFASGEINKALAFSPGTSSSEARSNLQIRSFVLLKE